MSITILHEPPKFQPVLTDGIFYNISASTINNYRFRYTYDLYVDNELKFSGKATPNPFGIGVIDVSRILKTYCENNPIGLWDTTRIYQHQTFPFAKPYLPETINYNVYFGYEYSSTELGSVTGFTGSGDTQGPPSIPGGLKKVFQSTMGVNGRATQQDFNIDPFVLSGDPTTSNPTRSGLFLTNSPRTRDLEEDEYYTLGFTNYYLDSSTLSEPYYAKWTFYDDQGLVITAVTSENLITNGGGPRTSCAEVYQQLPYVVPSGNTNYNTLYVAAGPRNISGITPSNAVQYTVQLFGKFTGTTQPIQPTPTPTPTPSSTPQLCPCVTFEVSNPSLLAQGFFTYTDCNRISQVLVVDPGQTFYVCICNSTSYSVEGPLVVSNQGSCNQPTPTPTKTPTPSPRVCGMYDVYTPLTAEEQITLQYTGCDGQEFFINLSVNSVYSICGFLGTFSSNNPNVTISYVGPC